MRASDNLWSRAEDDQLLALREAGEKWAYIGAVLPGRTVHACHSRHRYLRRGKCW